MNKECNMSLKDVVVCKFEGCNQIYKDARILPCGNRTCVEHIATMQADVDDTDMAKRMIKCHFCLKMHNMDEDSGEDMFPADTLIPFLLNMRHCGEHEAAKKRYAELSQMLEKLSKLDHESYVIDYFEQVKDAIELERNVNQAKLTAFYDKLVDELTEHKTKCLENLSKNWCLENELGLIQQSLIQCESKLKKKNFEFDLRTLNGDEAKWKLIQDECQTWLDKVQLLDKELKEKLLGDQTVAFKPCSDSAKIPLEDICGKLEDATSFRAIDSTIVNTDQLKRDMLELCKLTGRRLTLVYRATQDGFHAAAFHAKCDNQARTLTIIRSTAGYVFGAYTDAAWDSASGYKADAQAFIFSLINPSAQPKLIPIKPGGANGIYCQPGYGPTFGAHDIYVANNSNSTAGSYSNLGTNYQYAPTGTAQAQAFLAGAYNFLTAEVEVFRLS